MMTNGTTEVENGDTEGGYIHFIAVKFSLKSWMLEIEYKYNWKLKTEYNNN